MKKIICISIVSMFLLTGLTGVSALSLKDELALEVGTMDIVDNGLLGYVKISIAPAGIPQANAIFTEEFDQPIVKEGYWDATYAVTYHPFYDGETCKGRWQVGLTTESGVEFFNTGWVGFDYTGQQTPDEVHFEISKKLESGKENIRIWCKVEAEQLSGSDTVDTFYAEDEHSRTVICSKSNSIFNRPVISNMLLKLLDQFLLLQQLLNL